MSARCVLTCALRIISANKERAATALVQVRPFVFQISIPQISPPDHQHQGTMRLALQNASTMLNYSTTAGTLNVRAYSHARFDLADVQVVEIRASGDECNAQWRWTPLPANAHVRPPYFTPGPGDEKKNLRPRFSPCRLSNCLLFD